MEPKLIARIGAVIFVAIAIPMTAMEMSRAPEPSREEPVAQIDSTGTDPLLIELRRCQALGAAGANDRECMRAWAENRRRFLAPGARPMARIDQTPSEDN